MKVAILAPVVWRTPPKQYGPWEQVASNVAEGLALKNLEVTLFATADSQTRGTLMSIAPQPYGDNLQMDPKVWECMHIGFMMEHANHFDIIHNHYDFLPLTYSKLIKTPIVTTIHGFSSPQILPVFQKYNDHCKYVSISNSDRSALLDYIATVYNGIDTRYFTFRQDPKDYLLYFGRIHPEKGTYESIQIAKKAGCRLIISGLVQHQAYFDERVKPFLNDDDIIYVGNNGPKKRDELLGGALALLHPISFEEPFGLSVAEAMICGTPVIAFNRGSMPELIEDGKTGFLVDTIETAIEAVGQIKMLNRKYCSDYAIRKFGLQQMVNGYISVYNQVLSM